MPRTPVRRRSADNVRDVVDGVRRLERGLRLAAREVERATGLSAAQLFVLEHLNDGPATSLNELAARTLTDRSSVSVVVDRLVRARLARRQVSTADRRRQEVRISASGRAVLARAPSPPTDRLIAALGHLSRSSVRDLGRSLRRLNEVLGYEEVTMLFEGDDR